jgi:tetratricopeptide (TPR) repeat protein
VRALALADASGDPLTLVGALESRHAALIHSAHLAERLHLATELYNLAERSGERELKLLGLHWRAYDLLEKGDVDGARRETRQLAALAEQLRQPFYRHFAARWEVLWAMIGDRLEDVPALIARAHELGTRARAPEADIEAAGQQFSLAYRTGVLGQFAALLDAQIKENPQLTVNLPALALAHVQAGNRDSAAEIFARLAADDFQSIPRDMLWLAGMSVLADVCARLGDAEHAQVLYRILIPHRDRNILFGMATCWGSLERMLGLLASTLGDYDTAVEHFETAIERNATGGIDAMFEMVRRELADTLEARGAPGDAERAAALRAETLASAAPPMAATQIDPRGV